MKASVGFPSQWQNYTLLATHSSLLAFPNVPQAALNFLSHIPDLQESPNDVLTPGRPPYVGPLMGSPPTPSAREPLHLPVAHPPHKAAGSYRPATAHRLHLEHRAGVASTESPSSWGAQGLRCNLYSGPTANDSAEERLAPGLPLRAMAHFSFLPSTLRALGPESSSLPSFLKR